MRRALRHSAVGLPAALVAAMGAQAWYVGHRSLPCYEDLQPDGELGAAGLPEVRVALVGDSTITGPGLESPDDLWIRQVVRRLADRWRVRIASEAVGGARVRDARMYQVPRILRGEPPDVTIVSVGANDALRRVPLRRLEAELAVLVEELLRVSGTVVLTGLGDLGTVPRIPFPLRALASERSRVVDRAHARVAARSPRVFKVPVAELTNTEFRQRRSELFCADLFHPNREGHAVWADAMYPVLVDVLTGVTVRVPPVAAT